MGDGIINGGIAARFVEFGQPSFSSSPLKGGGGINAQVWPSGESLGCHLLMSAEIEDGLVFGPEMTPVEQFIECERLHFERWTPSPQQTLLEVYVTLGPIFPS
jgi:hypothetical protein